MEERWNFHIVNMFISYHRLHQTTTRWPSIVAFSSEKLKKFHNLISLCLRWGAVISTCNFWFLVQNYNHKKQVGNANEICLLSFCKANLKFDFFSGKNLRERYAVENKYTRKWRGRSNIYETGGKKICVSEVRWLVSRSFLRHHLVTRNLPSVPSQAYTFWSKHLHRSHREMREYTIALFRRHKNKRQETFIF